MNAETVQLERLARAMEDTGTWETEDYGADAPKLFAIIEPEEHRHARAVSDFWSDITARHNYAEPQYIEEFVAGALEKWDAVRAGVYIDPAE